MDNNVTLFEKTPVPRALASLAVPTIISQLIVMIYNLADTFFIGRTNDPCKIAAASMAYVLFFVLNALTNLFGIGGGTLISRLLGQKRPEEAGDVSAFSFYGTILVTALYCLLCYAFMEPILTLIGASENTMGYACDYTFWVVVVGGIPATLSMTMAQLIRSEGHGKNASFGLSMGGVLNIALDPLFMFVLMPKGQEVAGAAIATTVSNVAALLYYLAVYYRLRRTSVLSLSVRRLSPGSRFAGKVLSVGFPSALTTVLVCISMMVSNRLVANYGDIPLAAVGIVKKIEMLPNNMGTGLCQGMIPLVAYNYAAGNFKRMKRTINCARTSGIVGIVLCVVLFELFAGWLVGLFIKDTETVRLGAAFLRIMCIANPVSLCNYHMCYTLQAMGKGGESLLLAVCRQGLFNIPMLFAMDAVFGMYGVIWAQLAADSLTLFLSVCLYRRATKGLQELPA